MLRVLYFVKAADQKKLFQKADQTFPKEANCTGASLICTFFHPSRKLYAPLSILDLSQSCKVMEKTEHTQKRIKKSIRDLLYDVSGVL